MKKTQVYLPEEDLAAIHATAERTGKRVAELIREAVRRVWLRPTDGPVALWDEPARANSDDHDWLYDER
jgi:predicted regulator of Ras-like GTPase activity (Roadblock/LC7/MglB family)